MRSAPTTEPGRRASLRRPTSAVATALALLLAGLGGSASAAVFAPERALDTSTTNSSNKSVTTTCPAGKQTLGVGGSLVSGFGQVVMDDIRPSGLTGATVNGIEDETGAPQDWDVTAAAICAAPPPGLQVVSATSPLDSSNKSVTATCPAGKRVLGTGAALNAGNGQVEIDDLRPNAALTSVTVQGLEDENGQAGPWNVTAYAICSNPVAGLELVSATSALDSDANKSATATCSLGKQVVGTGANINAGNGQVVLSEVLPNAALTSVDVIAIEDENGQAGPWNVTAYAICADTVERVVETVPSDSEDKFVFATCPNAKLGTGVGGDITGGFGEVLLDVLFPLGLSEIFVVSANEDGTGTLSNWSLRSYKICVTSFSGFERVGAASAADSFFVKSATVSCPPGKQVLGALGETSQSGEVVLDDVTPNAALTSVTATGVEEANGAAESWDVSAGAVCANPLPGLERVAALSPSDSVDIATVTATCPPGKNLVGTGGDITGGGGRVVLDDLRVNDALTSVTVTGIEAEDGISSDWNVSAYAICITR